MQEGARSRFDMDFLADAAHIEAVQRLDRRLCLAFGGAEGGEIVLADEMLRGRMHRVGIELRARHARRGHARAPAGRGD